MAEADQEKPRIPFRLKFAIFTLMVAAGVFFPTTVLFCGCLIPSLVAALVDNSPQRTAWITVGCMNFAGTVPAWFGLWEAGHRLQDALSLLMQPRTLILAYGAAGVGWLIYNYVTPFVARIIVLRSERRLREIERMQKEYVRKWGPEVAGGG